MIRYIVRCGKYLGVLFVITWITVLIFTLLQILYKTSHSHANAYASHPRNLAIYLYSTTELLPNTTTISSPLKELVGINLKNISRDWHEHEKSQKYDKVATKPSSIMQQYNVEIITNNFTDQEFSEYEENPLKTISTLELKTIYIENITKDWHDHEFIKYERNRQGFGEKGEPASLENVNQDEEDMLFKMNGFNAMLSDHISVNRSVPDIRHENCQFKKYLSKLPSISVIIPFHNEHLSTLLRSLHSIINRTPPELLNEIIIVDDCSDKEILKADLDQYVAENFPKVQIIRLPERSGLITGRLTGSKKATSEVLAFLDSHIECNVNWLPPLLDPIAKNYKHCICPFIDAITYDTFAYESQDEGARGIFDWNFDYKRVSKLRETRDKPSELFESPVMAGGLFAISAKFFWELGGYDEGLDIWGGEQYELSFKIWQCGGKIYDAPCSRVAHIYRKFSHFKNPRKNMDYLTQNFKRVAEVWMDEYKEYLYMRNKEAFEATDPGDLTKPLKIREKLQCKPFKWFMEIVAFDLPKYYPLIEPPDYASGAIRSIANPNLCIDSLGRSDFDEVGIAKCSRDIIKPKASQFWRLSWYRDIRQKYETLCLDVASLKGIHNKVQLFECHGVQGNQYFKYIEDEKWLKTGTDDYCIELDEQKMKVFVSKCDVKNVNMKWEWGFLNTTVIFKAEISKATTNIENKS